MRWVPKGGQRGGCAPTGVQLRLSGNTTPCRMTGVTLQGTVSPEVGGSNTHSWPRAAPCGLRCRPRRFERKGKGCHGMERSAINEPQTDVGGWYWKMLARDRMCGEGRAARRARAQSRAGASEKRRVGQVWSEALTLTAGHVRPRCRPR
jgi:hypothetical protein